MLQNAMMTDRQTSARVRKWLEEKFEASGQTQAALARYMGVAPSAVSRLFRGERQLMANELIDVITFLELDLEAMLEILGKKITSEDPFLITGNVVLAMHDAFEEKDLTSVGVFPYIESNKPFRLPVSFLGNQIARTDYLRWVQVRDDDMSPAVMRDDILILDASVRSPHRPGVYVLEIDDDDYLIRRLEAESFGAITDVDVRIRMSADNEKLQARNLSLSDLKIAGRCVLRMSRSI